MAISVPSLAKYYHADLETGWIRSKGRALDLLAASAKSGKVSAQVKLIALFDQSQPHWAPNSDAQPNSAGEGEEAEQELSKKEPAEAAKIRLHWNGIERRFAPGAKANGDASPDWKVRIRSGR